MTPCANSTLFLPLSGPAHPELATGRSLLLADADFMARFRGIDQPAAVLSTCHQLVLANAQLVGWLGAESEESLVGSIPGDLQPQPGSPDLLAQTCFVECQGRGFFILTIQPAGKTQPRRPL